MGGEAGFLTGSMAALISNFYFGQGPWTPFQMLAWGLIGLASGLLHTPLKKIRIPPTEGVSFHVSMIFRIPSKNIYGKI